MGNTTPDQRAPYVERLSLALLLPRYIVMGNLTLIGGLGLMIMGVLGFMHNASPPSNPFTAYADVLPGQALGALDMHKFDCTMRNDDDYYHAASDTTCQLNLETGVFSHIEAIYARGLIHRLTFWIRDPTFTMGELAMWLELTEIHPRGGILFNWQGNDGVARVVNPTQRFSVLHRIWQVTLTDTPVSEP